MVGGRAFLPQARRNLLHHSAHVNGRFEVSRYLLTECQTERGKQAITLSKFASHYVPLHFAPWATNKNLVNKHDGENHRGGGTEGKMRGERLDGLRLEGTVIIPLKL